MFPAVLLAGSCYSSSQGKGADVGGQDAVEDPRPEAAVDALQDRTEAVEEPEPDLPPFLGIDFVVENISTDPDAVPYYFSMSGRGSVESAFSMKQLVDGEWVRVDWIPPWCTVECSEPPLSCCIDCALFLAVQMLEAGGSFSAHWDGNLHAMNYELCECGCYYDYPVYEGIFEMTICGYTDYVCYTDVPCMPDPGGMIRDADVAGEPQCISYGFEVPGDSGGTIHFYFPPGER